MAFDDRRFYCISRSRPSVTLRAIWLADGTPAWTSTWIRRRGSRWSIALAAEHVFAYPIPAVAGRGRRGRSRYPLIIRRRDTGTLVQRLVFPAGGELAATGRPGRGGADPGDRDGHLQPRPPGRRGGDAARRLGPGRPGNGRFPAAPSPRGVAMTARTARGSSDPGRTGGDRRPAHRRSYLIRLPSNLNHDRLNPGGPA